MTGRDVSLMADIYALEGDLEFAGKCAAAHLRLSQYAHPEDSVEDISSKALWNAALISYRRAFTTGRAHLLTNGSRLNLRDVVEQIVPKERAKTHAELMRLASKHVAHRTDVDLDNISFAIVLTPETADPPSIHSTELVQERAIGLDPAFVVSTIELIQLLYKRLGEELQARMDMFSEYVKEQHSMADLYRRSVHGRQRRGG
jgi:hypothetical protein